MDFMCGNVAVEAVKEANRAKAFISYQKKMKNRKEEKEHA